MFYLLIHVPRKQRDVTTNIFSQRESFEKLSQEQHKEAVINSNQMSLLHELAGVDYIECCGFSHFLSLFGG